MASGAQPGERRGGRKPGTPNKATEQRAEKVAESGVTPLDYMLQVLRDPDAKQEDRKWAATGAAPYVHARLQSTTVKGDGPDGVIRVRVVD